MARDETLSKASTMDWIFKKSIQYFPAQGLWAQNLDPLVVVGFFDEVSARQLRQYQAPDEPSFFSLPLHFPGQNIGSRKAVVFV